MIGFQVQAKIIFPKLANCPSENKSINIYLGNPLKPMLKNPPRLRIMKA